MKKYNTIKISCWNSRGFSAAIPYLKKLSDECDILAISEHWLHENRLSALNEISCNLNVCGRSSKFARADNFGTKRGQGGVALLWNRDIRGVTEISNIIHDRICGIRVPTAQGGILNVFSVYLPNQGSDEDYEACLDDLIEILESRESGSINILCGDFNADLGNLVGDRSLGPPNKPGQLLHKLINEFGLHVCNMQSSTTGPINTFFSAQAQSTLDYIIVPQGYANCVEACCVEEHHPLNTSDHNPVRATINIENVRNNSDPTPNVGYKKWDKLSHDDLHRLYTGPLENSTRKLEEALLSEHLGPRDLDDCIDLLTCKLKQAAEKIPSAKFRKHLRPYWNARMNELKKEKVRTFRLWSSNGRPRQEGNVLWINYKRAKKVFKHELKTLSKSYEDDQISQVVRAAEADRGIFWKLVKKSRKSSGNKIAAIKNPAGVVVSEIDQILKVWKSHFECLYTPKDNPDFDDLHYKKVTEKVDKLNSDTDLDRFLLEPFSHLEVSKAISNLHKRKACGYDGISTEHLVYGGECIVRILTLIYNHIVRLEYVPINLRRGIQIPLFKGKGTCCLEPDNYRGISLLTNYNKVYEILMWGRIKEWWTENKVISDLQGAGKKKISCVHTALLLQESIANALESHKNIFVMFLDVSKAYDTVWTDGLFYQLNEMGLSGRIWRLMYRAYQDFQCHVRIENKTSQWFTMTCGIHQGGFLSLTKYVAFINSLLVSLERSKLCCTIGAIPSTPVGYADDIATACISKHKTDQSLQLVHKFGQKWRFNFNAKKSAVLVDGETRKEHDFGSKHRCFMLGKEKVGERCEYDHVGIKACIFNDNNDRIAEKIGKGRRTLNAASGLGIRKSGITLKTCNLIFWSIVIPTVTFGCELWQVNDCDLQKLQSFQRYSGRRVQRFPKRSPNCTSYFGLGWLRIETFVQVKKLLFLLTFLLMDDDSLLKRVFYARVTDFIVKNGLLRSNPYSSPIFDMLEVSMRFDLLENILDMTFGRAQITSKKHGQS